MDLSIASLYGGKVNLILSEWFIKGFHAIVLNRIDRASSRVYRKQEDHISGASHEGTPSYQITNEMGFPINRNRKNQVLHPIESASILHSKFVNIHLF